MKPLLKHGETLTAEVLLRAADCSGAPDSCWNWVRSKNAPGYGQINSGGKQHGVHRLMLQFKEGRELARGECACHKCDNPSCINPAHLFVGTYSDNAVDKTLKGRHHSTIKTHCPHGHAYDEANTYYRGKRRHRKCRKCHRIHTASRYDRFKKKQTNQEK